MKCNASWIIKNMVARSSRPGYGIKSPITEDVAEQWLECIIDSIGVKPATIITFLHDEELYGSNHQLGFYDFNLFDWYHEHGIETKWFPTKDPIGDGGGSKVPFTEDKLKEIKQAVIASKKPVLIHCSAGIDRTGTVAYYIINGKMKPTVSKFQAYHNQIQKFDKKYRRGGNSSLIAYGD